MLKIYKLGGLTYQFEEGQQPAGAVPIEGKPIEAKKRPARNKAAKPANKAANADE